MSEAKLVIELVKPSTEQNNRHWDEAQGDYVGESFSRGERIIAVNGKRWGRTVISHHGCWGTAHTFRQDEGGVITGEKVLSSGKRICSPQAPTLDRVLEKVTELVTAGRLRNPDIIKAENERAQAAYLQHCADEERNRKVEFRVRAMVALRINDDDGSEIIDRIVAAMEWAADR